MAAAVWLIIVLLIINTSSSSSLNQPKFSSCANWSSKATTFAKESWIGQYPIGISINERNTIYVTNRKNGSILVWHNGSMARTETIFGNLINSWSLFATISNNIYVDNGHSNHRVDKWTLNGTNSETVMNVNSSCTGLFVDIYNSLYCSSADKHRVFKVGLSNNTTNPVIAVGTGCPGPVPNMLDHPHGIFVDNNTNLYVADSHNNRIQRFAPDQLNAITVAGFGATMTFLLNRPTGIVLDADGNLFIVDNQNHRIIRSINDEFQCLIGCSGNSGTSASHLNNPQTMAFDTIGNIFVTDSNNHRVQKFSLTKNTCFCPKGDIVLTFDDLTSPQKIPDGYNNISWSNAYVYAENARVSGYVTAIISGQNVMYNDGGNPMTMRSANGRLLNLYSAAVAAAWYDNLQLTIVGYKSNVVIATGTFTLQVFTVSYLTFNGYSGLDTITFMTSGGTKNAGVSGSGTQYAMDNIHLSFTCI